MQAHAPFADEPVPSVQRERIAESIAECPMPVARFDANELRRTFRAAFPEDWKHRAQRECLVLIADLREWRSWTRQAATLLDGEQAGRVASRRFANHRDELIIAYALHRLTLAELTGGDASMVALRRDSRGRPYLWNCSLETSLSHAAGWVAIAVTGRGAVGVDIENSVRAIEMPGIADMVCHASELPAPGDLEPNTTKRLLELWVRKEALLKAAGVGLAHAMVEFAAPAGESLPLYPQQQGRTELTMIDAGPECVGAVAAPPGVAVVTHQLRPSHTRGTHPN